jgi:hypothetical protein
MNGLLFAARACRNTPFPTLGLDLSLNILLI